MIRKNARGNRVALAWYEPEECQKLRGVPVDVDVMEKTYEEWMAHAQMALREGKRAGVEIVKVEIVVDELVAWCEKEGLAVNGRARAQFAAEKARRDSLAQGP